MIFMGLALVHFQKYWLLSRLYDLLFGIDFRVYWVEISSRHMCFSNFLLSLTLWTKNHYSNISLVYQFLTYPVLTPSLFHLQCTLMQFHKTSSSDNFTKNVNTSIRSVCQLCFWRFSIIYRMRAIITRSLYNSYPIFHCGLYYRPFMY